VSIIPVALGTAPDGAGGDNNREGFGKVNASITELDVRVAVIEEGGDFGDAAFLNVGTVAGTVAAGNDARLGTPTSSAVAASRSVAGADQNTALICDTSGGGTIVLTLPDNLLTDDLWTPVVNKGVGTVSFATSGTATVTPADASLDNTALAAGSITNATLHHVGGGVWHLYIGSPQIYDTQLGFNGVPAANAEDRILAGRQFVIDSADPGELIVGTNPTSSWVLDIQVEGVSVGDVTVNTSGVPTWGIASDVVVERGEVLSLVAPGTPDATAADVLVAFRGFTT